MFVSLTVTQVHYDGRKAKKSQKTLAEISFFFYCSSVPVSLYKDSYRNGRNTASPEFWKSETGRDIKKLF